MKEKKPLYVSNEVKKYHNVTKYVTLLLSSIDSTCFKINGNISLILQTRAKFDKYTRKG